MNSGTTPTACVPTWHGYIETTRDALLVFEACFQGVLHHCRCRPHDKDRGNLIVSGRVFVYEEVSSGIKRWTDGLPWSPSRILTNFLIYRQLNTPFPSGEKKRAAKRTQRGSRHADDLSSLAGQASDRCIASPEPPSTPSVASPAGSSPDLTAHRGLVGSLVDSYEFKEDGLLKKTMTVVHGGVHHHLVSYYSLEDAKRSLMTPRQDVQLKDLTIRETLLKQPKFKFPNLDDAGDGTFETIDTPPASFSQASQTHAHQPYPYASQQYSYSMSQSSPHAVSGPVTSSSHAQYPGYFGPQYPAQPTYDYQYHMPQTSMQQPLMYQHIPHNDTHAFQQTHHFQASPAPAYQMDQARVPHQMSADQAAFPEPQYASMSWPPPPDQPQREPRPFIKREASN